MKRFDAIQVVIFGVCLVLALIFLYVALIPVYFNVKWNGFNDFGGYIGGLAGIIGSVAAGLAAYFAWRAWQGQKDALELQERIHKEQMQSIKDKNEEESNRRYMAYGEEVAKNWELKLEKKREDFERVFFEMVRVHRDNVAGMRFNKLEGYEVLLQIITYIGYYDLNKISNQFKNMSPVAKTKIIQIVYAMFLFGYNIETKDLEKSMLNELKDLNILEEFIKELKKVLKEKNISGWDIILGGYFRHLYHIVDYVDKQDYLSYEVRYEYVKILRGMLSNAEVELLFYNSLSSFGKKAWYEKNRKGEVRKGCDLIKQGVDCCLMEKYALIKNIPRKVAEKWDAKGIYPNIVFEYEEWGV